MFKLFKKLRKYPKTFYSHNKVRKNKSQRINLFFFFVKANQFIEFKSCLILNILNSRTQVIAFTIILETSASFSIKFYD